MAGIEPASERFDHRISTSVVGLLISPHGGETYKTTCSQPLEPESPLLCGARQPVQHFDFVSPALRPVKERCRQTDPRGDQLLTIRLRRRGALQRRKCDWHLIFCTDFTRSVPLGSQPGTSLPRRDQASPVPHLLYYEVCPRNGLW